MKKLFLLIPLILMLAGFTFPKPKDLVHVDDVEWTKQALSGYIGEKNQWEKTVEGDTTWYHLYPKLSDSNNVDIVVKNNKVSIVNFSDFNQAKTISIMEDFGIGVAGPIKKVFNRNQRETMFLTDKFLFYLTDTFGQTQIYTISFQYDPEHVEGVIERDKD